MKRNKRIMTMPLLEFFDVILSKKNVYEMFVFNKLHGKKIRYTCIYDLANGIYRVQDIIANTKFNTNSVFSFINNQIKKNLIKKLARNRYEVTIPQKLREFVKFQKEYDEVKKLVEKNTQKKFSRSSITECFVESAS